MVGTVSPWSGNGRHGFTMVRVWLGYGRHGMVGRVSPWPGYDVYIASAMI